MTYRIWITDHWHFTRNKDNTKSVFNFKTFDEALEATMSYNLAGAEIWKLEGVPKVAIQRLT